VPETPFPDSSRPGAGRVTDLPSGALSRSPTGLPLALIVALSLPFSCTDPEPARFPDRQPLLVSIRHPPDGALVGGWLEVRIETSSGVPVTGVELSLAGRSLPTSVVPPHRARIDTTAFPDGPARLEAVAGDTLGRRATHAVEVLVDNTPPVVRLRSPDPEGPAYFDDGGIDLHLEVEEVSGLSVLDVRVNGLSLPPGDGPPYVVHVPFDELHLEAEDVPFDLVVEVRAMDRRAQVGRLRVHLPVVTRVAWAFPARGEIWKRPAVGGNGELYLGTTDGDLFALDPRGTPLWAYDTQDSVLTAPVVGRDGTVLFAAGTVVHALEPSGLARWTVDTEVQLGSSPALGLDGTAVYLGTYDQSVLALATTTGEVLWAFSTGGDVLSSPTVGPGGVVYVGCHDFSLYALSASGEEQWRFETGGQVWGSPLVTRGGSRIVVGSNDGYVYVLSPFGTPLWDFQVLGQVWGRAAEAPDGTVYVGSTSRSLYALDPAGAGLWQVVTGGLAGSSPVLDVVGTIYVGSTDGRLYAVAPDGAVRWTFRTEAEVLASPVLSPDQTRVYVGSTDRRLYALETGLEPQPFCPPPGLLSLDGFAIMAYEASRVDATADSEGTMTQGVCSRPGVRPWVHATWGEARAACAGAGMDLCTVAQWEEACRGADGADYPYGPEEEPATCNGGSHPQTGCSGAGCRPVPAGSLPGCRSAAGAFDMSGNVREWTGEPSPVFGERWCLVRGGSYRSAGDALRCPYDDSAHTHVRVDVRSDDLGFRCCRKDPEAPEEPEEPE